MSTIKDNIKEMFKHKDGLSFVELSDIEGFGGGGKEMFFEGDDYSNIVVWSSMTDEAVDAINELIEEEYAHLWPTSLLVYIVDGGCLKYPVAKKSVHYKEPHWLPCVLNLGPTPEKYRRRKQTKNEDKK